MMYADNSYSLSLKDSEQDGDPILYVYGIGKYGGDWGAW
jgi:hypothetical protein